MKNSKIRRFNMSKRSRIRVLRKTSVIWRGRDPHKSLPLPFTPQRNNLACSGDQRGGSGPRRAPQHPSRPHLALLTLRSTAQARPAGRKGGVWEGVGAAWLEQRQESLGGGAG